MMHTQCSLKRGQVHQVAWIPANFAIKGMYLKINGENGWMVEDVGGQLPSDYVVAHERDYVRAFASLE